MRSGWAPGRGALVVDLADATPATCGGKAAPLARLLLAGLDVPPGFVVTVDAHDRALAGVDVAGTLRRGEDAQRLVLEQAVLPPALVEEISGALSRTVPPEGHAAVRSSATDEDGSAATAAGQHDTVLGVRGADQVADAVRRCWASLWSGRAVGYRRQQPGPWEQPGMAVLVQPLVDADVAGVMFTGPTTVVEASWGLGESVVGGHVTPDSWAVAGDAVVRRTLGAKHARRDRVGDRVVTTAVAPADRGRLCLTDEQVLGLVRLGRRVERVLGQRHDVEWAVADGRGWLLQARLITATVPAPSTRPASPARAAPSTRSAVSTVLLGTPASPGRATGPARVLRDLDDSARVRSGDVVVCAATDPAWTPLFALAAAVVTETGGLLSHAAIVAREHGLPAVVAVPGATAALVDGAAVAVDGGAGRVVVLPGG